MSPSIIAPSPMGSDGRQTSIAPIRPAPSGWPSSSADSWAPLSFSQPAASRPLVPFVPVRSSVVEAIAAAREALLEQWHLPIAPPSKAGETWQVRAMLAYLRDTLLGDTRFFRIEVFVGGSYPNYRMQVPSQRRPPRDLDPLFRIARAPGVCFASLEHQVRTALKHVLSAGSNAHSGQAPYLSSRIELSVDGHDAMLRVSVGVGHEHADMRFIFADQHFSPYDFRCNALLVNAFDSAQWTVLDGPRPEDVMADIAQGIYCADHALHYTGVGRAAKMRAMGLVPAAPQQDAPLWQSLFTHLTAGGPDDPLGAGLRFNAVFRSEVSRAYTGATAAQDAGAILANALVGLHAHLHLPHASAVYTQLHMSLYRVLARCAPSPVLTALQDIFSSPERVPRAGLFMQALAADPRLVSDGGASDSRWPVERPMHAGSGHIRYFCGALDGFVCWATPTPHDLQPFLALAACTLPPNPLQSAAHVAWLLDMPTLAQLLPDAAFEDADARHRCGVRLGQLAGDYYITQPSTAQRLGLAALALCPRAPLAGPVLAGIVALGASPLSRSTLVAWHHGAAEQATRALRTHAEMPSAPAAYNAIWRTLHDACVFFTAAHDKLGLATIDAWQALCRRAVIASARLVPSDAAAYAALARLIDHVQQGPAQNGPQWFASCLHLRSQLGSDEAHVALRGALRRPLRQLQQSTRIPGQACLLARDALQVPHGAQTQTRAMRLAICLSLVPGLAHYLDETTALDIARRTNVHDSWHARQAVRHSLLRLCDTPRFLRRLCRDMARLQDLISVAALRSTVLTVLQAARIDEPYVLRLALRAYAADGRLPFETAQCFGRLWPADTVMQELQHHIALAPHPQALMVLWRRIRVLSAAAHHSAPLVPGTLFASVLSRLHKVYNPHDNPSLTPPSIGYVRAWRAYAPVLPSASRKTWLGLARLYLLAGSPKDAMHVLQPVCGRALQPSECAAGLLLLVQDTAEVMAEAPCARHTDALKAMARTFVSAPHLDRAHLPDIGQTIRALCFALSQHGVHRLAGELVQHAFAQWHQRSIVWAFGAGPLWGTSSDLSWAKTLQRNSEEPGRQLIFVQLADRTVRATLTSWADALAAPAAPKPHGACLDAALSAVWLLIQARAQHLPLRQHDMVFQALIKALQTAALARALQNHLDALLAPVDIDDVPRYVGLWQAWLGAAPDAATLELRQARIMRLMNFSPDLALRAQWPTHSDARAKLGAAMAALLPMLYSPHTTSQNQLSIWNDVVAALMQGRPQMAWLDAALSCSIEAPARMQKRLEVHMLMRLRALCKDPAQQPDAAEFAIAMLHYALAMGSNPDNAICARASLIEQVLQMMQTQLVHPFYNWLASVATFWDVSAPNVRAAMPSLPRLRAHMARAEAQKRCVPHADAMQTFSEESLAYFLNAEGLEHLSHGLMFLGESAQDRLKQWACSDPWRLALMYGFRHTAWYEAVLAKMASCNVMKASPNQGYLLAAVIDGLWDTGHLRYGPVIPLIHIAARLWRNTLLRPGIEAAMAKLTLYCQHHEVSDALDVAVALRRAEVQHRLSARGAQMMQQLVDALGLSDAAVLTATAQSKVISMHAQLPAN